MSETNKQANAQIGPRIGRLGPSVFFLSVRVLGGLRSFRALLFSGMILKIPNTQKKKKKKKKDSVTFLGYILASGQYLLPGIE